MTFVSIHANGCPDDWSKETIAMYELIQELFTLEPSPLDDQAPALMCYVLLRGAPLAFQGSMSETEAGLLRMLTPEDANARPDRDGNVAMMEMFFAYKDVMTVSVRRKIQVVPPSSPRIFQG